MKSLSVLILFIVVAAVVLPLVTNVSIETDDQTSNGKTLLNFSSYEELKAFLNRTSQLSPYYRGGALIKTFSASLAAAESSVDYSTTNIQVEGVDEIDILKTDGKYIYIVSDGSIFIVKAYPPEEATILSRIDVNGTVMGIFINQNRLVVIENGFPTIYYAMSRIYYNYMSTKVTIKVYDLSDGKNPVLTREVLLDGWYFNSRMIGEYVYVMVNAQTTQTDGNKTVPVLPKITSNGETMEIPVTNIYYADVSDYSYTFTIILTVNVQNDEESPTYKTVLMGSASSMYMSQENIYIAVPTWATSTQTVSDNSIRTTIMPTLVNTLIYRIHVAGSKMDVAASGEVPGTVLNQFSMDEYNTNFRIATTTDIWSSGTPSRNNVYVLNMNLSIVGRLEDLAPGERIYSARFIGDRCYLVTFKKVDPLFVIDLKDPVNPQVLGKLKIPGYSDYLHPYGENHLIGIGKETVEAEEGDFAWYQGVKVSLFDVSDVDTPKEIAKYEIGDRGTDSPVLTDHKALLFIEKMNLLAIPVLVAEIDKGKYPNGVPSNAYGDYVWQGVYVFNVSQDGLSLKGRITHLKDAADLIKSSYYFFSQYSVKRALYIEDVLYTVSDKMIKMNNLTSLEEIGEIELP